MTDITPRDAAESVALEALSFLSQDPDRVAQFLANAGIGPHQLRDAAREPGFLTAVLDHLLSDEPLLLMFAENADMPPTSIPKARQVLVDYTPRD